MSLNTFITYSILISIAQRGVFIDIIVYCLSLFIIVYYCLLLHISIIVPTMTTTNTSLRYFSGFDEEQNTLTVSQLFPDQYNPPDIKFGSDPSTIYLSPQGSMQPIQSMQQSTPIIPTQQILTPPQMPNQYSQYAASGVKYGQSSNMYGSDQHHTHKYEFDKYWISFNSTDKTINHNIDVRAFVSLICAIYFSFIYLFVVPTIIPDCIYMNCILSTSSQCSMEILQPYTNHQNSTQCAIVNNGCPQNTCDSVFVHVVSALLYYGFIFIVLLSTLLFIYRCYTNNRQSL